MVAVELDRNYIDVEPSAFCQSVPINIPTMAKATGSLCPNWHILDNEAPAELKEAICENKCKVELTPADQHRRNAAEHAIQTFKGYFISILAGVADNFLIHQWDELRFPKQFSH
jgi:hypothetical protein